AQLGFLVTKRGELQLQLVAAIAYLRRHVGFAVAADQMKLVSPQAVERGALLGPLGGPHAAEPRGRRAEAVAVIVEQGVLRRQSLVALVDLRHATAGSEIRFQQRRLPVLVEIGGDVADRAGEVLAEAGEVEFESAFGRRDHDATRARRDGDEWRAGRRAI